MKFKVGDWVVEGRRWSGYTIKEVLFVTGQGYLLLRDNEWKETSAWANECFSLSALASAIPVDA